MGIIIQCPYFKKERKKSITCEDTIRSYFSKADKKHMLKAYCSSQWKSCPYASRIESIWALDLPEDQIKERIMENTLESMKTEINKLMRENGQLMKKLDNLRKETAKREEIAKSNHEMYADVIKRKDALLDAQKKEIQWLQSFASAFLAIAYGEDAGEIRLKNEDVLKLMTEYSLEIKREEEGGDWIIHVHHKETEIKND